MKLTGRKAYVLGNKSKQVEIINEPVLSSKDKFIVLTLQDGRFVAYNVVDLELLEETTEEWQPDWSKIKYDHLRMDTDGSWWSFERDDDLRFDSDGDWFATNCDNNHEDYITYKHPNPKEQFIRDRNNEPNQRNKLAAS